MINLEGKTVLLTGGSGFLGRVILEKLKERGAIVLAPRSRDMDLMSRASMENYFYEHTPDIVIHSAATYGGIMINQTRSADIFYENTIMYANVFEVCANNDVEKLVNIGSACSFPGEIVGSLCEDQLWNGPCHESVANYGAVKRMMTIGSLAYKRQHNMNSTTLILTNLYGKHDVFTDERSHVVAALLRKFAEAILFDKNKVEVWGSGSPVREFLFVDDAAEATVLATEKYDDIEPINIGCGIGVHIEELVHLIKDISGFDGSVVWDSSKPDGAYKKVLDVTKMKRVLGWYPKVLLEDGLRITIDWLMNNYKEAMKRK